MKIRSLFLIMIYCLVTVGCVTMGTVALRPAGDVSSFGKARISLIRSEDVAIGNRFQIKDNGETVGYLGTDGEPLVWDRVPGLMHLDALINKTQYQPFEIQIEPGINYLLKMKYLPKYKQRVLWTVVSAKPISHQSASFNGGIAPTKIEANGNALPDRESIDGGQKEEKGNTKNGQHWAVVVGVSKYRDSRIPSLRYAATDAKSFYEWLVSPRGGCYPPSRVKLLLNQNATRDAIREALFEWLGQALEEDALTIYFAGHGSPQSPDNARNLFLLPYDADYRKVATTGFPMWDIETALKRFVKARKVIVIADACHSGGVGESYDLARRAGRGIKVNAINSGLNDLSRIADGVCVITASDDKQFSQESRKWGGGHGVFTYYLLEGLQGEADYSRDGRVTLGELVPYLSEQVRRATRNAQSPTVAGKFDPAMAIGK